MPKVARVVFDILLRDNASNYTHFIRRYYDKWLAPKSSYLVVRLVLLA